MQQRLGNKCLGESGLLLKGVTETIQKEAKKQKRGFLSMLFVTIGASLLENILADKRVIKAGDGTITKRKGPGITRAGYLKSMDLEWKKKI